MSKETKKPAAKKAAKGAAAPKTATRTKKTAAAKKSAAAKPAVKKAVAKKAPAKKAPAKKAATRPRVKKATIEIEEALIPVAAAEPEVKEAQAEVEIEAEEPVAARVAEVEPEEPEIEPEEPEAHEAEAEEPEAAPRIESHVERLQKILSHAGIASRRHAEELIVAGRVMVNGEVVTHLGAKADAAHDHIRVDGKLIDAAERLRTFVLNKPKGYVTTVSDPEGRPTVMEFFKKFSERLYPVGRLDFQSEGLLLMSNDGELANSLTRAASGVEKTYLVKIAGQPSEEDLDKLRSGVAIERGEQGSQRVRTAPAEVRQIRSGNNPWFEVVLTEGRNRELRKMFQTIGHYVEKIRRVGYGPLALDVEPGQFRELRAEEVDALRLTAEGKLKPRRPRSSAMLPRDAGKTTEEREERGGKRFGGKKPFRPREDRGGQRREGGAARGKFEKRGFGNRPPRSGFNDARRDDFRGERGERPRFGERRPNREEGGFKPRSEGGFKPRREERFGERRQEQGEGRRFEGRPRFDRKPRFDREPRGESRFDRGERPERGEFSRPRPNRPSFDRSSQDRPRFDRPRQDRGERPSFGRKEGLGPRRERKDFGGEGRPPRREFRPREASPEFRGQGRPSGGRGQRGPGKPGFGAKRGGFKPSGFKGGFKGKPGGAPRRGRG